MAHPHNDHRDHHKQHSRVAHIIGRAHGGHVSHPDEKEDVALIKREVKGSALKHGKEHRASGGAVSQRQDKVKRARGGRTGHKGKGHTSVNVIVAPQQGGGGMMHPAMHPMGGAMPAGAAPAAPPPAMPPHPPMAGPPGASPMGAPGMMPPRRDGGRTYAKGGRIKSGDAYEEGRRNGTQVQNNPSGKNDLGNLGRGKPITYKTGGAIEASKKMGPKYKGGAGGAAARVEKGRDANRHYVKA